ncbi:transposase family protein [Dactylosporangium sp. CS-047395]|uniref:transposase family protein n=1 Tax=Dactylosporangium sp. CS-047395 TaxID=3239936 RepID=UPI003D9028CB
MQVEAESVDGVAACPGCGVPGRRVHSRYQRRVADPAMAGRRVWILVRFAGSSASRSAALGRRSSSRSRD